MEEHTWEITRGHYQELVMWPHLTARETGRYSPTSSCVLKEEKNGWVEKLVPS